jgi:hypothetical protein
MEALLRASDVDWIAPRFPAIVDGPTKPLRASADSRGVRFRITTGSCATFMLDQLADSPYLRVAPSVSN